MNKSITQLIKEYIVLTGEYGKPSSPDSFEYFWTYFGDIIINNGFNPDISEVIYDSLFDSIELDKEYTGGVEYYKWLISNQHKISSLEKLKEFSSSFVVVDRQVVKKEEDSKEEKAVISEKGINKKISMEVLKAHDLYSRLVASGLTKVKEVEHYDTTEMSKIAKQSEYTKEAEHSGVTSSLDDRAKQDVRNLIQDELNVQSSDLELNTDEIIETTEEIHQFDTAILDIIHKKITETDKVFNIGITSSGKSYQQRYYAFSRTGYKLTQTLALQDKIVYKRVLVVQASMSKEEFLGTVNKNGIFPRFCEANKESEECYLIIDEIIPEHIKNLLAGSLWNTLKRFKEIKNSEYRKFTTPSGTVVEIPRGLRVMVNITTSEYKKLNSTNYEDIVTRVGTPIYVDKFTLEDVDRICKYTGIPKYIAETLIKAQLIMEDKRNFGDEADRFIQIDEIRRKGKTCIKQYIDNKLFGLPGNTELNNYISLLKQYIEE